MDRRRFLKVTAITGASAALASCGHPEHQIIRFIPDDDIVPGIATWKPSVCPLCPAGCGLHVRVMDADVDVVRNGQRGVMRAMVAKKLEGLPDHPVNRGALCARGQAAIQVTYHPDRLRHPLKRSGPRGSGQFEEVTWEVALGELTSRLDALADAGKTQGLRYLTRAGGSQRTDLAAMFLARFGAPPPVSVALFDEEVLRRANALSFGVAQLPTLDLAGARFVVAFGADYLGTWNSPVAQAAAYGAMRQGVPGVRGAVVQVEARMSQTGANADWWVAARPGTEGAMALGMAHVILREGLARGDAAGRAGALIEGWGAGLPEFAPERVEAMTGIPGARVEEIARAFAARRPAVAIIGGPALAHTNGLAQALAVNALNALVGSVGVPGGLQFTPPLAGEGGGALTPLHSLSKGVSPLFDSVEVLLVDAANPVFLSPAAWGVRDALEGVPFIASFGSFLDETSILADLVLPDHSFLESWAEALPESGSLVAAASLAPPVMRPLYSTRATPDVLLDVSRRLRQPLSPPLPWQQFDEMLRDRFGNLPAQADGGDAWAEVQARGGWWGRSPAAARSVPSTRSALSGVDPVSRSSPAPSPVPFTEPRFDGAPDEFPFHLLPYASTTFYDGSTAHLPWLQEMPDPMTSAMWSNWVEVNPVTARRLQLAASDIVEISSQHGSVRAPVVISPGVAPDVIAMPVGQGHDTFTRFASGRGSNPIAILAPLTDSSTGALAWAATRVRLTRVADGGGELTLFAGHDVEHPHQHR
ncbi:MAG: molybdopterin-containing oxidoreductase family protein [Acidobacteriota bacterium]